MNHNGSLLRTLYTSTSGKYLKLKVRLEKARQSGRFYTLSGRKQHSLLHRLKRLFERLKSLQAQLRLSGIGAAIALAIAATPAEAQSTLGPYVKEDPKNPLPPPAHIAMPKPASVDIDGDGDLDVFVGDKYGNIHFFRNTAGKDLVRRFVKEEEHPLDFVDLSYYGQAAPAFIDIDGDGDFDLLVGTAGGYTYFFRNTGTTTAAVFEVQYGALNPFDGVKGSISKYGNYGPALPTFADIDNDSDIDLIIGSSYIYDGEYSYTSAVVIYYNNGGEFSRDDEFNSAFGDLNYGSRRSLAFIDLDGDGDLDIIAGGEYGGISTYLNNGTSFVWQYGEWNSSTHTGNPFYNAYLNGNTWVNFVDLDDDGDLDALIGSGNNYSNAQNTKPIQYFENTGDFVMVLRSGLNLSPFDGVDVYRQATPTFSDIDGDGDLDAILGSKYSGELTVYKNMGGFFVYDPEDPLTDFNMGYGTLPIFVDIDGDGDQDLFVTSNFSYYSSNFFKNNENTFSEETSPLDLSSFTNPSLAFIDVDNDGDFDAFVFDYESNSIEFFKNTGDATDPSFQSQTAPAPFNTLDFDRITKISAVDVDHDGDLDLIVSGTVGYYYELTSSRHLENAGGVFSYYTSFRLFDNAGNGSFTEMPSPFNIFASSYSFLNLADIDGDGDLDLFIGYGDDYNSQIRGGTVAYYENQNPAPLTSVSQSSISVTLDTPAILDPDLTIEDEDEDDIVQATVTISNFTEGNEELDFTSSNGVTGQFEDGILTLTGKASIEDYETILRTVTYEFTGNVTSAREASGRAGVPAAKTVTFVVRDTDFTNTIVSQVSVIALDLNGEPGAKIVVYNAVSPGVSESLNDYMRINGLPTNNTVSIFNRWGDEVFKVSGYDNNNASKRFEGKNDNGKDLPAGNYYYIIEADSKKINGYLSLKR